MNTIHPCSSGTNCRIHENYDPVVLVGVAVDYMGHEMGFFLLPHARGLRFESLRGGFPSRDYLLGISLMRVLVEINFSQLSVFAAVKSADPFKVKVGERTLAEGEVPLLTETTDMVIVSSDKTVRLVSHTIVDEIKEHSGKNKRKVGFSTVPPPVKKARTGDIVITESVVTTAGKSSVVIKKLITQSVQANVGSGSTASHTKELFLLLLLQLWTIGIVRILVRLMMGTLGYAMRVEDVDAGVVNETVNTSLPENKADAASLPGNGAETSPLPRNGAGTSSSVLNDGSSIDDFFESRTIDTTTAQDIYVPHWDVTNDAQLDDPYEHEILTREKFEQKFVSGCETVQQKDVEIVSLKATVEKAEGEATKVIELHIRVSELETAAVVKLDEVASLTAQNAELSGAILHGEVAGEAKLRAEFLSVQDVEVQRIAQLNAELDARIVELNHDMDNELYPHMLTAVAGHRWIIRHGLRLAVMKCSESTKYRVSLRKVIFMAINKGIQEGLEAGIEHGRAGRSLAAVEAYDSRVEAKYVVAVHDLENCPFPLLDQLEALKDSPLELLMSSLTLEGSYSEHDLTPEFRKLHFVSNQVTMPVYYECGGSKDPGSISHEILMSDALAASHARCEKHKKARLEIGGSSVVTPSLSSQVASLVAVDHQVSSAANVDGMIPSSEPHDDFFDATVLDKPVDS
ncbi:hypothetical protein Tco_0012283 [Tanacetum coccineum]